MKARGAPALSDDAGAAIGDDAGERGFCVVPVVFAAFGILTLHLTLHLTTARAACAWALRRSWCAAKLIRSHRDAAPTFWFILYELIGVSGAW